MQHYSVCVCVLSLRTTVCKDTFLCVLLVQTDFIIIITITSIDATKRKLFVYTQLLLFANRKAKFLFTLFLVSSLVLFYLVFLLKGRTSLLIYLMTKKNDSLIRL